MISVEHHDVGSLHVWKYGRAPDIPSEFVRLFVVARDVSVRLTMGGSVVVRPIELETFLLDASAWERFE